MGGKHLRSLVLSPLSKGGQGGIFNARSEWIDKLVATVMSQAQNLEEKECRSDCERLVDSFALSLERKDPAAFLTTLEEVLQRTLLGDDDAHIWEDAVSLIGMEFKPANGNDSPSARWVNDMMDQTRLVISDYMQQQHRQYVSNQRWISSRLSLLTASLLTALDEVQIYAILAKHLPAMDIQLALIALFEAEGNDPSAWSLIRNALAPEQPPVRYRSALFPPEGFFAGDRPFHLILIPLVDQAGPLGYMIFGIEYFDLYGAIVQQLGGALNTARLYRQATEGRRLAEEANRMKSRFLSTISHELRTPLNLIVGLSGMVLRASAAGDTPLPELAQKDIERIHMYSQHLGGLIGDVLDLATSDAGQLRLNNHPIDLAQTLRVVAESGCQLAADKGLAWEAELPDSGPWVWGDPTRLRQVALNLINNAIKFTQQGSVKLRLEISPDTVLISVSDTGLGISLDEQQIIFDEFRQSERSVALGYGGLGLGLAISKRLVEMHGGKIGVRSSGQAGAGSTFYFTLPLEADDLAGPIEVGGDEHTILVVDDEPNTLDMHARIVQLHSSANRVLKAQHGREALEILEHEVVDLVLLDLQMPEMDGFCVLETMRGNERMRNIPVIVLTGKVLSESDMERLNRKVAAVLEKGLFSLDETASHINAALERKRKLSGEAQRLVRKAMAFIHQNYAHSISRRDIAQHVSIAEDHLTYCFRQELGATPIEYLQRYRVNQAKRLLKDSERAITEIALDVGFSDSGYFSRIFRRITGMTPEAYRRSQ
jgi:signal transduction histidine kinase/AraC-like DNA-binding protein